MRAVTFQLATALAVALVPGNAIPDSRAPDRLASTLGYTSLVRADSALVPSGFVGKPEPLRVRGGRFDVWLRGDHATLRARLAVSSSSGFEGFAIAAGVGFPSGGFAYEDPSQLPGSPRPGRFPVLLTGETNIERGWPTARLREPSEQDASSDFQRNLVDLPRFGFEEKPKGYVRRWLSPHWGPLDVVWTVAYAGDTYHGTRALDCSCGESFNFGIANTYVVIDPSDLGFAGDGKIDLIVHNALPLAVEALSLDGSRTLAKVAAGGEWRTPLDPAKGGEPFIVSFLERWTPGLPAMPGEHEWWSSRLEASCAVPTVDTEEMPEPDPKRPWDLDCTTSIGKRRTKEAFTLPTFLRSAVRWNNPAGEWFAAGLYRQLLSLDAPKVDHWPALERLSDHGFPGFPLPGGSRGPPPPALVRVNPKRYRITASATVGERNRIENLSDGDPDTAWCAPAPGHGRKLVIDFKRSTIPAAIHVLPGFVRTPWLYEANAVPTALRIECDSQEPAQSAVIPYLAVPDLYREGVYLPLAGSCSGHRITIEITELAAGRFSGDVCISEIVVLTELR